MKATLHAFFPIAVAITVAFGTLYINEQQSLRLSANEPQDALADQSAAQITAGQLPASIVAAATNAPVRIESTDAPYVVFYDTNGNPLAGDGLLNGVLPHLPQGVFDVARMKEGKDRITWQPQTGVRQAIVVEPVQDSAGSGAAFVMAGRSLAYTEQQITMLGLRTLIGWLAALFATIIACALAQKKTPRR